MRYIIICLFLVLFSHLDGEALNEEESAVLTIFFKTLIEKSEGGYVLQNVKPVCFTAFTKNYELFPETELHKMSVALREGAHICEKNFSTDGNFIIKIERPSDERSFSEVLLIDKNLFLKTVKENEVLFKYVLGPNLTAESLLKEILNQAKSMENVLKNDNALVGILLGFGTLNSIYGARWEVINDHRNVVTIPFKSQTDFLEEDKIFCLLSDSQPSILHPSFGFNHIDEERRFLDAKLKEPSLKLNEEPRFIFACLQQENETQNLVPKLETAQLNIKNLIQSNSFLKDVVSRFSNHDVYLDTEFNENFSFSELSNNDLNQIIAKNIWSQLDDYDNDSMLAFLNGFCHPDTMVDYPGPYWSVLNYKSQLNEVRKKFLETNLLFSQLHTKLKCLKKDHLYCNDLQEGSGELLDNQNLVLVTYEIFDFNNNPLTKNESPIELDLNSTISGFAYGIKGMREGGVREIFIHPCLAYGLHMGYLKALVKLEKIIPSCSFPELNTLDLTFVFNQEFEDKYIDQLTKTFQFQGARLAQHFAKNQRVSISDVYNELLLLKKAKAKHTPLTEDEYNVINRLHWNIYFGKSTEDS